MRLLICFYCILLTSGLYAQYDPEAKVDPLGRPYRPVIGMLEPIVHPEVPAEQAKYLSVAFSNGVKGNAYTPYDVVSKSSLQSAVKVMAKAEDPEERQKVRKVFYYSNVGAEYLAQPEIVYYNHVQTFDSIRDPESRRPPRIIRIHHFYANMTVRLTDVATSKVILCNNFNLYTNSRELPVSRMETDSLKALQNLYEEAKKVGSSIFVRVITGVAQIVGIHGGSAEDARSVLLSNSPIIAGPKGEFLPVYLLEENFEVGGQHFLHAYQIGLVSKGNDYDHRIRNYQVKKGSKEIGQALQAGKMLVVTKGEFPGGNSLEDWRKSVVVESFKAESVIPRNMALTLEDQFSESLVRLPQLVDVVDREIYHLLEAERKLQHINLSDATQAGVSIGAEYILNTEILDYQINRELVKKAVEPAANQAAAAPAAAPKTAAPKTAAPKTASPSDKSSKIASANETKTSGQSAASGEKNTAKPPAVEKPTIRFVEYVPASYKAVAGVHAKLTLVKVQTGEIVWSTEVKANAQKDYPLDHSDAAKITNFILANQQLAERFAAIAAPQVMRQLLLSTPILRVEASGKKGVSELLIGGGSLAGFRPGHTIEVVEVTTELVDGESLRRETVIATLKAETVYPETTRCKIKKGTEELTEALQAKRTLYCRQRDAG